VRKVEHFGRAYPTAPRPVQLQFCDNSHFAISAASLKLSLQCDNAVSAPRRAPGSEELARPAMVEVTMYRCQPRLSEAAAGAQRGKSLARTASRKYAASTPHSLRATTATLLLDGTVDIYDKLQRGTSDSASHLLVI
jgi:hypothetical protein